MTPPSMFPELAGGARSAQPPAPASIARAIASTHALIALLALLCAVPLLIVDLPPMTDIPGHVGRMSMQLGLADDPWLQQFFTFEWKIIGNLGADLMVEVLAPLVGLEPAVRLVTIGAQMLAATGILLVSREAHGRITAFAILALPLIYGFPFNFGFLNYSISMGLALLAFALWLRMTRQGATGARSAVFAVVGLAVWLCHTYGWGFLGILCTADCLVRARQSGQKWIATLWSTFLQCAPLLLPLLPMMLWRGEAGGETDSWMIERKFSFLFSILHLESSAPDLLSALFLFATIYFGWRALPGRRDARLMVAAAITFIAFLVMPMRVFGSAFADIRLPPYAVMLALLSLDEGWMKPRARTVLLVVAGLFLALRLTLTSATYYTREAEMNRRLEALSVIPEHARIVNFTSPRCPGEWGFPWITHYGGLAIARKHAFVNEQWNTPGMNLLSIHYPAAGAFESDESQIVKGPGCVSPKPTLSQALAAFPAKAFTHVWIVGVDPATIQARPDMKLLWRDEESAVYALTGTARQ